MMWEGWTALGLELLGHQLWQGMVLVIAAALLVRLGGKAGGAMRYRVWSVAFSVILLLPVVMLLPRISRTETVRVKQEVEQSTPLAPIVPATKAGETTREPLSTKTVLPVQQVQETRKLSTQNTISFTALWQGVGPALLVIWLLGVLFGMARLTAAYAALVRLAGKTRPLPDRFAPLQSWFDGQIKQAGLKAKLVTASGISSPLALGFARPAVVLPDRLLGHLQEDDVKRVILHELAHLKRGDAWSNLFQRLGETLFWYHPGVIWTGRRMAEEREMACDAWAASQGGNPKAYAGCLLRVYETSREVCSPVITPRLAVGALSGGQLSRRIATLMEAPNAMTTLMARSFLMLSLMVLVAGGWALTYASPRPVVPDPTTFYHVVVGKASPSPIRPVEPPPSPAAVVRGDEIVVGDRSSIHINGDDDLRIELKGRIVFSADETEILEISHNGYFFYQDSTGEDVKIRVKSGGKGRYWVNGRERSFETEGRAWLRQNLARILAEMAVAAEQRMTRMVGDQGVDRTLDWINGLHGHHARSVYYRTLLKQDQLDSGHMIKVVGSVSDFGDYEMARVFRAMVEKQPDVAVMGAIADKTHNIDSDYEKARVLRSMLEMDSLTEVAMKTMTTAAVSIDSDYEKARFFRAAAEKWPLDLLVEGGMLEATESIESDYEQARLMRTILAQGSLHQEEVLQILETAGKTIQGDYELARVYAQILSSGNVDQETANKVVIHASEHIEGDHELQRLLRKALNQNADGLTLIEASGEISSEHDREYILRKLISRGISEDEMDAVLDRIGAMSNQELRANLLRRLQKYGVPAHLESKFRGEVNQLSDHYRSRF